MLTFRSNKLCRNSFLRPGKVIPRRRPDCLLPGIRNRQVDGDKGQLRATGTRASFPLNHQNIPIPFPSIGAVKVVVRWCAIATDSFVLRLNFSG